MWISAARASLCTRPGNADAGWCVVYAQAPDGSRGLYVYDRLEGTFQRWGLTASADPGGSVVQDTEQELLEAQERINSLKWQTARLWGVRSRAAGGGDRDGNPAVPGPGRPATDRGPAGCPAGGKNRRGGVLESETVNRRRLPAVLREKDAPKAFRARGGKG